jgi:hypothetical protein
MPGQPAKFPCPDCRPGAPCPRHCGAKKRQGDGLCQLAKGQGTSHPGTGYCELHGGSTPNGAKHAEKAKLAEVVRTYGAPVVGRSDADVLAELIATAFGHVSYLAALIAGADDLDAIPAVVLERYDVERNLLAKMVRDSLGAGVAARQVRLAEEQGAVLGDVMRAIIGDLFRLLMDAAMGEGLSVDVLVAVQTEKVPAVIRHRLAEVVGGGA